MRILPLLVALAVLPKASADEPKLITATGTHAFRNTTITVSTTCSSPDLGSRAARRLKRFIRTSASRSSPLEM
jgi:hypothetical protein